VGITNIFTHLLQNKLNNKSLVKKKSPIFQKKEKSQLFCILCEQKFDNLLIGDRLVVRSNNGHLKLLCGQVGTVTQIFPGNYFDLTFYSKKVIYNRFLLKKYQQSSSAFIKEKTLNVEKTFS